jgi:uncharacterized membrane protein
MDATETPGVFDAPVATPKKGYSTDPEPGGRLPEVGQLLSETMAEFMDKIGPYILAGLGLTVVVVPIAFATIFVAYFVIFGGMLGISMVGIGVGAGIAENVNEGAGAFVMLVSQLLAIVVPLGAFVVLLMAMLALMAPLHASLVRAVAEQQRGGKELDFTSAFSTAGRDVAKVLIGAALITGLALLGALACYVPALAVTFLFGFVGAMVALHGVAPVTAMRANLRHALDHLWWHVLFGALYLVVLMVGSYVPVLGTMFVVAFHVRAYRVIFGDGEQPALEVAAS